MWLCVGGELEDVSRVDRSTHVARGGGPASVPRSKVSWRAGAWLRGSAIDRPNQSIDRQAPVQPWWVCPISPQSAVQEAQAKHTPSPSGGKAQPQPAQAASPFVERPDPASFPTQCWPPPARHGPLLLPPRVAGPSPETALTILEPGHASWRVAAHRGKRARRPVPLAGPRHTRADSPRFRRDPSPSAPLQRGRTKAARGVPSGGGDCGLGDSAQPRSSTAKERSRARRQGNKKGWARRPVKRYPAHPSRPGAATASRATIPTRPARPDRGQNRACDRLSPKWAGPASFGDWVIGQSPGRRRSAGERARGLWRGGERRRGQTGGEFRSSSLSRAVTPEASRFNRLPEPGLAPPLA